MGARARWDLEHSSDMRAAFRIIRSDIAAVIASLGSTGLADTVRTVGG